MSWFGCNGCRFHRPSWPGGYIEAKILDWWCLAAHTCPTWFLLCSSWRLGGRLGRGLGRAGWAGAWTPAQGELGWFPATSRLVPCFCSCC